MMTLNLTGNERFQIQTLLPAQGDLKTLESVERMLDKVKINEIKDVNNEKDKDFDFEKEEIELLKGMISVLDQGKQLSLQSLSLIRKIMNVEEKN